MRVKLNRIIQKSENSDYSDYSDYSDNKTILTPKKKITIMLSTILLEAANLTYAGAAIGAGKSAEQPWTLWPVSLKPSAKFRHP